MTAMLTLQRRHSPKCPDYEKGPDYLKCRGNCLIRAYGTNEHGKRVRTSLRTRDLQRGARRLTEMEDRLTGNPRKKMIEAVALFQAQHEGKADETKRRYNRTLNLFIEFCAREQITYVDQVTLETMDRYVMSRKGIKTWTKDVELLRQLFEFCRDRDWTTRNPAKALRLPRVLQANDAVPFKHDEIVKIIAACDSIGRTNYERRRARAMTLLMRYAGLRISDVVTLKRNDVQGHYLVRRAVKNNKLIRVEVPPSVIEALDALPLPKAAAKSNNGFFSKDGGNLRSLVKGAWRTMSAVFKRSGVLGAHPHRFRHTLASELLGKGGSVEEIAGILGDSPVTVRRYYAKWTPEFQTLQDELVRKIHGTHLAQPQKEAR